MDEQLVKGVFLMFSSWCLLSCVVVFDFSCVVLRCLQEYKVDIGGKYDGFLCCLFLLSLVETSLPTLPQEKKGRNRNWESYNGIKCIVSHLNCAKVHLI